jgi:xylan 1,4-beta-xylosidase
MPRGGLPSQSGFSLSDDFSGDKGGIQWSFFNPGPDEGPRFKLNSGYVELTAKGSGPADRSPLTFVTGDRSYEAEVSLEVVGKAHGGLLLFYSERIYCGIGFSADELFTYNYGQEHPWMRISLPEGQKRIRLRNDRRVVTIHYATDGRTWVRQPRQMETSGMHHNVFGGFTSLKIGLYSAGEGIVKFSDFTYRGESSLSEPARC